MSIRTSAAAISLAAFALTAPLAQAQTAPAPDKLPDWHGVWMMVGGRTLDPTVKNGQRQQPPLNPEAQKRYTAILDAAAAGTPVGDIGCLPSGTPRIMRSPYPLEFAITPQQVWMLHEFKGEVRRIYTDGRKHPPAEELDPSFHGHSIGHWEGDTLVVETIGLRAANTLDSSGLFHSDQLTVHERIRRVDHDTLEDQITLTDPKTFTRPWQVTRTYKLRPDFDMKEFVCTENERNPIDAQGRTTTILTPN